MMVMFAYETVLLTGAIYATIVLMYVTAVFLLAQLRNDNSVMDIAYGPAFAVSYWVTWYLLGLPVGVPVLVGGLVTLWALRLGIRIGRKNWGKPEDVRYAAWREQWLQRGQLYFILRSYLQVNLLQGLIIVLVATPLWWVLAMPLVHTPALYFAGVLLMLAGLSYESVADWQLDRFIAKKQAGTSDRDLMTDGLFRYSRRPNYFGESLVWWGFALLASATPWGWVSVISPLLLTYILTQVTGPMLERMFAEKFPAAFSTYKAQTNYFIPGPAKTITTD